MRIKYSRRQCVFQLLNAVHFLTISLLFSSHLSANPGTVTQYEAALKKAGEHDYVTAIALLKEQIAADSSMSVAFTWLADYFHYANMHEEGKTYFTNSSGANAYLALARLHQHQQKWPEVFQYSRQALQAGLDSHMATKLMLDAALRLKNNSALASQLRKLRSNPDQEHLYHKAYTIWRLRNRDFNKARKTIDSYLTNNPTDSFAHLLRGDILQAQGENRAATTEYLYALEKTPAIERRQKILLLTHLGVAYFESGKLDSALSFAGRTTELATETGALFEQLDIALRLRTYFKKYAYYRNLKNNADSGIFALEQLNRKRGLVDFQHDRAFCLTMNGEWERAMTTYELAYALAEEDFAQKAELSLSMAELCVSAANPTRALTYFERAETHAGKAGKQDLQHQIIFRRATILTASGQRQQAKLAIERVLRYAQKTQQHKITEQCFTRLANLFLNPPADFNKAEYYLSMADALSRQTFQLQYAANHRWMQGNLELQKKDIEQAETYYLHAIQLGRETGSHLAILAGQAGLIRTYLAANFHEMASTYADTAMAYLKQYRTFCLSEYWAEFFDLKQDLFEPAIISYSNVGDLPNIYATCDYYKALKHTGEITDVAQVLHNPDMDSVSHQITALETQIKETWINIWNDRSNDQEAEAAAKRSIRNLHLRRNTLLTQLAQDHPEWYHLIRPDSQSLNELQSNLKTLNSIFIHYFVGKNATFVLVVQPNSIYCDRINVPSAYIEDLVRNITPLFRDISDNFSSVDGPKPSEFSLNHACQLYELLIQPIEGWLNPKQSLIISADGLLNILPFELLVENPQDLIHSHDYSSARFLVESYPIYYAPLASFAKPAPKRKQAQELSLVMSAPTAQSPDQQISGTNEHLEQQQLYEENASKELESIQIALGRRHISYYNNITASKENFLELGKKHRIIHLAVPGTLEDRNPQKSYFEFFGNERLTTSELFTTELKAELVILSKSKRKLGDAESGNSLANLLHGFNFAGTPSIVTNLWKTKKTESHASIYENFYTNLKAGLNKAKALQQAKIEYLSHGNRDPYHWAGLVLSGSNTAMKFETNQTYLLVYMTIIGLLILLTLFVRQFHKFLKEREGEN